MTAPHKTDFKEYRVMYRINKGDIQVTMRVRTTGLEALHRILCQMSAWRKPVKEWDELIIHETRDDGVVEMDKTWLCAWDGAYEFGKGAAEPRFDLAPPEKDGGIGGKLTSKYVRRHQFPVSVLSDKSLMRSYTYAH